MKLIMTHGYILSDTGSTVYVQNLCRAAAIALPLDLQTWRTLVRGQGLGKDRAVELMVEMLRCLMRT